MRSTSNPGHLPHPVPTRRHTARRRPFAGRVLALGMALTMLALSRPGGAAAAPAGLRAGAATANITPPLGIEINGGTQPVIAGHVHDELHARALVLDDGPTRLALVTVDNCLIPRAVCDEAKSLIAQHTGIPPTNVCISATHTHSAGSVAGAHLSEPDADYARFLARRISDAVRIAANRLAPAEIGRGRGSVPQHVFCRRIQVRPGITYTNLLGQTGDRVKMNWSSPEPAVDGEFSSVVDPEVSFLSVRHVDGRPLALFANYSLHYVGGVGPGHVSADYFGEFCREISSRLNADRQDPPFVAMLSNGTSGDINNVDYRVARPKQEPYEQIRRVATDVAREVQRALAGVRYSTTVRLQSRAAELPLAVRKPSPPEVARARGLLAGRDRSELRTWTEIYARETLILAGYPDTLSLPVQVFQVGDLVIAQWPGEIFAVSGLGLKASSPLQPLFNISLANGWFGYIPPPEQHALGSYETWRGRTSPLETNAIPRLLETYRQLLDTLR